MHIITTSSQVVKVITRSLVLSLTLELRDEQTKVITTKAITGTQNGNLVDFDLDFTPTEEAYYTFKLLDGSNLVYRGQVFCTDETPLDAYKITSGDYTSPTSNNEYAFA